MTRFGSRMATTGTLAVLVALAVTLPGCGDDTSPAEPETGQYGSLVNSDEFTNAAQALPVEALREPPGPIPLLSSYTLTNTPAIAQQGTTNSVGFPGSCEAQSYGYALGSYTAARAPDGSIKWNAGLPGNEVSAAYQFALAINQGFATCGTGLATNYLSRLTGVGSPSAADVPYQPSCSYFSQIDLAKVYPDEKRLRIGSFAAFAAGTPSSIALIKGFLANNQALSFSGGVFTNYGTNPVLTNGVYYNVAANIMPNSGHGQLIVGYDDNIGTPGKTGALLVQNSFGTTWPPSAAGSPAPAGMLWWAYSTFQVSQKNIAVAYPYDPAPPTGSMLTTANSAAPVASIERAFQWAPGGTDSAAYLIFIHHLADPVKIVNVTVKEPAPGTETVTGGYGQYLSKGYTYLKRVDGKEFLPGVYQVKMQVQLLNGLFASYTGSVTVGHAQPATPEAASMKAADNKLFDSLNKPVTVAISPVTF